MKTPYLLCFLFFFVTSCSKNSLSPTQGELTAAKLKADISGKSITSVYISFSNGSGSFNGTSYTITSDGFINVVGANQNNATYNLEQLKFYQIYPPTLYLDF